MMMKIKNIISLFPLLLFFCFGCNGSDSPDDTPTYGQISISVDETFKPLIDSEIFTFEGIYNYTDVNASYKTEMEAFNDLMNDTIRLIIVPRQLNKDELKEFEKWEIVPKVTKIAYDAVALISSKDLKDSTLTLDEIKTLLSDGSVSSFKNVKVVFDNNNSSTINFLKEKTGVTQLSSNCYALTFNSAVIDYVAKEKNSIGVIGVNWISDRDDTTNLSFLNSVRVMEISTNENSEYFKPYQAYIAQKIYPLWREVYIISKEAYTGLGTGLTAFIASERGQRIVLKFGLVPATMPVRLVELINEEITY
ncbi:MAG: phosphate transporter substrate-binding protein, PhoT family [Ignavibacteriaceae bacterium]|nr:phosphate transporter substrate-binding protein, PhoT family [Ignavibacteriaceae bacterium]